MTSLEDAPVAEAMNLLAPPAPIRRGGAGTAPAWPHFMVGQPEKPVRVLVIDDDPGVRRVMVQSLLRDPRVTVEGQAGSLAEGRRLLARTPFDVALIDLRLGDGSGLELIEAVRAHRGGGQSIAVSTLEDEQQVLQAFEFGATGYLLKHCWFQDYAQSVLEVANGGAALTPTLARRLLGRLERPRGPDTPRQPPPAPTGTLSARERDVLRLVAAGHINSEIGAQLNISEQTVHSHIKSIYRKLNAHTRAQAVSYAGRRGVL